MCLAGRDDAVAQVGTLERLDVGAAELRGEIRVLAVGLLDPAPARIARDVEDRRERMPGAGQQHPTTERRGHRRHDVGSKLAAAPIDCWKHGASEAMSPWRHSSWTMAGMPEPGPLDEIALDRVGGLGHLDRAAGWSSRRAG